MNIFTHLYSHKISCRLEKSIMLRIDVSGYNGPLTRYHNVPIRSTLPNRRAPKWVCQLSQNSIIHVQAVEQTDRQKHTCIHINMSAYIVIWILSFETTLLSIIPFATRIYISVHMIWNVRFETPLHIGCWSVSNIAGSYFISLGARFQSMVHIVIHYLTHWGRDKMEAISQTTLSNPFSLMKML